MRPTDIDAFRAAPDERGIALEFGRTATSGAAAGGAGRLVMLSDRIALTRDQSLRLLHGLRETLARRPEAALALVGGADPAAPRDAFAGPSVLGATPVNLPPDPAAQHGEAMLAAVRDLGVPYQHERSFRLAPGKLQANRFLLSLDPADLGQDAGHALARVFGAAQPLGLPAAAQAAAREHFDGTLCVHFGFEAGDGAARCKLYLERKVPPAESEAAAGRGEPVLLHRAYKWDPARGDHVESHYHWFPGLDAGAIAARLRALYAAAGADESLAIALDVLALAAPRFASGAPQYLEVSEPGNGRRSFDLNLYDANLTVGDVLPALIRMRLHHGIRPGQFQALVDQVRARALGHLAGGLHRGGEDFFNVYYGVAGFPRFVGR